MSLPSRYTNSMTAQQTLSELVAIDSVSARSNSEIVSYLTSRCEALGLTVKHFPYRDDSNVEKLNVIALSGEDFSTSPSVELALVGHTDTVPYDPKWTEATTLTERDEKLFARGACDTKGFIASALAAVEAIVTAAEAAVRQPSLTSDEAFHHALSIEGSEFNRIDEAWLHGFRSTTSLLLHTQLPDGQQHIRRLVDAVHQFSSDKSLAAHADTLWAECEKAK